MEMPKIWMKFFNPDFLLFFAFIFCLRGRVLNSGEMILPIVILCQLIGTSIYVHTDSDLICILIQFYTIVSKVWVCQFIKKFYSLGFN